MVQNVFLDRIWRLFVDENGKLSDKIVEEQTEALEKTYHQTVKKVTEDYANLHFNTAISQMMVFINEGYKQERISKDYVEGFIKLIAPITPHIAEEIWEKLGHSDTISYETWPTYDESKLVDNEVEVVLQVMGKVRAKISVAKDISKEELERIALKKMKQFNHGLREKQYVK